MGFLGRTNINTYSLSNGWLFFTTNQKYLVMIQLLWYNYAEKVISTHIDG